MTQLQDTKIKQVVICGIETHVCVQQTALDFLTNGFQVHMVRDATSSRKKIDHKTALERMQNEGVIVTNAETVLFELLVESMTPEFKDIYKIM